jgi:Zn-dependent peptidase ImmA (M78 family)
MRNIPRKLIELGFNRRALTFSDFEAACEELGVKWFFTDEANEGMYFVRRGYPIIVLSKHLSGFMLLWVAWHELIHFMLHPPDLRFFVQGTEDKFDAEANDIAVCCVLPKPTLRKLLISGDADQWLYPRDLMQRRCNVLTRYGI